MKPNTKFLFLRSILNLYIFIKCIWLKRHECELEKLDAALKLTQKECGQKIGSLLRAAARKSSPMKRFFHLWPCKSHTKVAADNVRMKTVFLTHRGISRRARASNEPTTRPAHCRLACHSQLINFSAPAHIYFFISFCQLRALIPRIAMSFEVGPISARRARKKRARTPTAPWISAARLLNH